ncbi:MAG: methyltransferase domain-containing protein, partial [Rubrivivax sp.]|nr:methyltransferase domain-containing protein [Rubrivivax sp.]
VDLVCDLSQPLPLPDATFDTIVFSDVLEHLPEPVAVWHEMARLLAPGGRIVLNVPFYYSVHAHPHDYARYTRFALERFAQLSGLRVLHLQAVGGLVESGVDLLAKALSKLPLLGRPLAVGLQSVALAFAQTRLGARLAERSAWHFPLGYFMVVERPVQAPP